MHTRPRTRLATALALVALATTACSAPAPVTGSEGAETGSDATAAASPADPATSGVTTSDTSPGSDQEVAIGLVLPFTGEYSWVGANVQPVAEMVVEEVNANDAFPGSITLVQGDTEGVVDAGVTAARKLATADGVVAFVGPTSLSFTGVRQVIEDTGVVMISPTAGTTELDDAGTELFFRTVPSDSLGGRAIAAAIGDATVLGRDAAFESPALLVGEAPALVSFAEPVADGLAAQGMEPVANASFVTGKQSYRSEIADVLAAEPDVVVLVAAPEDSAQIMREAFEAGYEGAWFVTQDQTNADYVDLAGAELVEGTYGLVEAPFADAEQRVADFSQRLQDFAGVEPDIFSLNTYDAVNVLALASLRLALAGEQVARDALPDAIRAVGNADDGDVVVTSYEEGAQALQAGDEIDYQGLVGPVDFDDNGNITAPFAIQEVVEGTWTTVTTLAPEDLDGP